MVTGWYSDRGSWGREWPGLPSYSSNNSSNYSFCSLQKMPTLMRSLMHVLRTAKNLNESGLRAKADFKENYLLPGWKYFSGRLKGVSTYDCTSIKRPCK